MNPGTSQSETDRYAQRNKRAVIICHGIFKQVFAFASTFLLLWCRHRVYTGSFTASEMLLLGLNWHTSTHVIRGSVGELKLYFYPSARRLKGVKETSASTTQSVHLDKDVDNTNAKLQIDILERIYRYYRVQLAKQACCSMRTSVIISGRVVACSWRLCACYYCVGAYDTAPDRKVVRYKYVSNAWMYIFPRLLGQSPL